MTTLALSTVERVLRQHVPKSVPLEGVMKKAAVAAVLRERPGEGLDLLLIRRAVHDRDPWSGHMAFPGGRVDPTDTSPLEAARRETLEEIGLDLSKHGRLLGELSHVFTAPAKPIPMVVHPFVYALEGDPAFVPSPEEVAETIWVPLGFLTEPTNRGTLKRELKGVPMTFPSYDYDGRVIWGLTLRMIDELLEIVR